VGPRAGLEDMEKRKFLTLLGLELRPLGRPARNQSLYRMRYPGSIEVHNPSDVLFFSLCQIPIFAAVTFTCCIIYSVTLECALWILGIKKGM
jgi:hypothetical protein